VKLFIDECIWRATRDFVQNHGHDISTVEERGLIGADDETVLRQALSEKRVFLTRDMHFSNTLLYPPENYNGIIVLRIKPQTITEVHRNLATVLSHFTQNSIRKSLIIVNHNKFRERR